MRKDDCSRSPAPAGASGMALDRIWTVDADPSYDVRRRGPDRRVLVAVRTQEGVGRLEFDSLPPVEVGAETLLVLENQRLRRYYCAAETWKFWWFEFTLAGPLHAPLHQVMRTSIAVDDFTVFNSIYAALRREPFAERACASAGFAFLLYRWLTGWREGRQGGPHQAGIDMAIERMHETLERPVPVRALATVAHLGERRFRTVFREATGASPKVFYERLRLAQAQEWLRLGIDSVSAVADRLGYSSPFHFSKAYHAHFGRPPSRERPSRISGSGKPPEGASQKENK